MPRALVTGISGYVGNAVAPRLQQAGWDVRGFARDAGRVSADVEVVEGDATSGAGLDAAMDDVDVAYFLIHSMEGEAGSNGFGDIERRQAENFAQAAQRAGVRRVVYLGGPVPEGKISAHLGSRLVVEETLLEAVPDAVAFRASILIGARSRPFRFLVRLVERFPILALPAWGHYRTAPIDERDVLAYLTAAATQDVGGTHSLDIPGPELLAYGEIMERIRDLMILGRPRIDLPITLTPIAAKVAAAVSGEDVGLIEPLMGSLTNDLLPRDDRAAELFDIRRHSFDSAVEHALGIWEREERLAAR